jgi:hypothetical protein
MTDNTFFSNDDNDSTSSSPDRRPYHSPKFINLGEIHSLVMTAGCGHGDVNCGCLAS